MDQDRMISSEIMGDEEEFAEMSLRPQRLSQYIGQDKIKKEIIKKSLQDMAQMKICLSL